MPNKRYRKIPNRLGRHFYADEDETPPLNFEVGLHPYAEADFHSKLDYIANQSEHNAALVEKRVYDALWSLRNNPHWNRKGRAKGTYELPVRKTRLIIAFVTRPHLGVVVAVRLMHSSQMWPTPQLERLALAKKLSVARFVTRNEKPETV